MVSDLFHNIPITIYQTDNEETINETPLGE